MQVFWRLLKLAILAVVALLLWLAFRPGPDFAIIVKSSGLRIRGRFPEALRPRLAEFLQDDLLLQGTVRIAGRRREDGSLALSFRGPLSEGDRQRIRNFLANML